MPYKYFSHNGDIVPLEQASVPLSRVEYSYGFGVYETIRVSKGTVFFADEHCQRLMNSAQIIDLAHPFTSDFVLAAMQELIKQNDVETCNLKILLIGGPDPSSATLDILCLNPLFPDRNLYKTGATCITYNYEREFPGAKTLNMLSSYLAYREAARAGAYDALLINRQGCITEGTRTNFFAIQDRTLVSPPSDSILPGVTRDHVLKVARQQGFQIIEQDIKLSGLDQYDGAFITSTPIKILPLRSINNYTFKKSVPPAIKALMTAFEEYLQVYITA
jgi:branched-chain amino acid aminotransferase